MVKLSKEEKKKLNQEKKAEKQREKDEAEKQIRKDKLDRELEHTRSLTSEIRRKVFEQALVLNLPIVREEVIHKWGYFERSNDWKDYYISQLREDIYYYELHHRMLEQKHNENVDKLTELYSDMSAKSMELYEIQREKLLNDREQHIKRLVLTQQRRVDTIKSAIYTALEIRKEEFDKISWDNGQETQLQLFSYEEAIIKIAQIGDDNVNKQWSKMKTIFDKYKMSTSKQRREYLLLKDKDLREMNSLENLTQRITQLHKEAKRCREKLGVVLTHDTKKKEELEMKRHAYRAIRKNFRDLAGYDDRQIQALSILSNSTLKNLNTFVAKAREAISLLSINRKLETEEEKVAPKLFFDSPPPNASRDEMLPLIDDVEHLWTRITRVSDMNVNMAAVLNKLRLDNRDLKEKLSKVLRASQYKLL